MKPEIDGAYPSLESWDQKLPATQGSAGVQSMKPEDYASLKQKYRKLKLKAVPKGPGMDGKGR